METKHTPGPWSWTTDTLENRCDQTLDSETTGYSVLHCCVKPREPNARLIAAAPDLLEACKAALSDDQPYIEKCKAAIAKATGA